MLRPQGLFINRQRPLVERLGLGVVAPKFRVRMNRSKTPAGTITGRVFRKLEGDEELEEETPIRTVNDKYVMLLRRESDGGWRIVWLIWNSSEE